MENPTQVQADCHHCPSSPYIRPVSNLGHLQASRGVLARQPANPSVWPAQLEGQGCDEGIGSREQEVEEQKSICRNFHICGRVGEVQLQADLAGLQLCWDGASVCV